MRYPQRQWLKTSPLQMTAMIDIVFQLLVFFIMTFQIVPAEGDFFQHSPQDIGMEQGPDHELVRLEITANTKDDVDQVSLNNKVLPPGNWAVLEEALFGLRAAGVEEPQAWRAAWPWNLC